MKKISYLTLICIIFFLVINCQSQSQIHIPLISNRISDNVIVVSRENGSGNQLALNTDKGIVVFNSNWGPGIQLEYNKIIENEFNSNNYNFIINTGSNIRETGGNVLFKDLSIIVQKDHYDQIIENQKNLENLIQREIGVFTRKAERSRNILKGNELSKDDQVLHSEWMKYCQRIADDLKLGYELVLPSIIFERQLILDLGNMTLHLEYFPDNGLIIWIPEEEFLSFTGMFNPMHIITSCLRPTAKKLEIDQWLIILDKYISNYKEIENVHLGWSGIWPMQKIEDRTEYIKHLWSSIQKATENNKDFNTVMEELSIDNEFKYVKTWELYTEQGDSWVSEDHYKNLTAFWKQLHLAIGIYTEEYIEQNGVDKGLDEFNNIIKSRKNEFFITEAELNSLGYRLMNKEMIDHAIAVFKANVGLYPESANAYDSLGEAYMKNGNIKLAVKYYKKSLELNPNNTNAKEMLEQLKN